ncbi:class I SAM-dependent methyltransferase [Amycolatopsis antarctica]|uniref:class I SAM-dependent methyltransferase n=1 Tax=Amycolatopsis antarctica TaxID=1854586 RepID=UPI001F0AE953|nr:methyltransferase domain-containing protein [Amycolatopsis antarctica]
MTKHRLFGRLYPAMSRALDQAGMAERRTALLTGLTGEVVEIGAGHGVNFAHYPPTVTRVLAVEPQPHLRVLAAAQAAGAPVPVEVADGDAEHLTIPDRSVDAVVVSLVLCSVRGQDEVLSDARRVLTPGGQLRFLEHVRAGTAGLARVQRALDTTIWPHLAGGCRLGRDTLAAIHRAGFTSSTSTSS